MGEKQEMIHKKAAAELVIKHIETNIKIGVVAIIIPFLSIAFYMALGQIPALIMWVISFGYIAYILFRSKRYKDYLIQKYKIAQLMKKQELKHE